MNKNRQVIRELQGFFKNNDSTRAMDVITTVLNKLRIQDRVIGSVKNPNCKFTNLAVLQLLVLFPFFRIRNAYNYSSSHLYKLFHCEKDMFYRFMNDGNINWRGILYSVVRQLYTRITRNTNLNSETKCLIIDDTELPKRGFKMEKIGKVFSHGKMKSILGFKAMFLCLTDGVSQFLLDFSLHGEEGKKKGRPQGLSIKEAGARYAKPHSEYERISGRSEEYLQSKISTAIKMLRRAITEGVRFNYLLVDSWFTCSELLRFTVTRRIGAHLIGMIKMSRTHYDTGFGSGTAPELVKLLGRSKRVKYARSLGYYHATADAVYAGIKVKLFFYRRGRNGRWNALLCSDLNLDAKQAFRLYSRRWVIEVVHKEMKQRLGLGRNQCRDFAGQIAGISLCVLQYNILSYAKRWESYETIGGLFARIKQEGVELSVAERIWLLIVEVINVIAEIFNFDVMTLTKQILSNDKQIRELKQAFDKLAYSVS